MPPARYPGPSGGSVSNPAGPGNITVEQWEQYIAVLTQYWQQSSGFEQRKLEEQIREAERGRQNAWQIAQLQSETSRYGVNVQQQTALAQLKENARQFDQTHKIEMQRLGLDYADKAAQYLSTPDRYFQADDYMDMAGRVMAGKGGPRPYGATGPVTAKTEADFAVLSGFGRGGGGSGMQTNVGGYGGQVRGGGSAVADAPNGAAPVDPRTGVLKKMIDAIPPSQSGGMDDNDFAVLTAAKALYSTNLRPGEWERMRPGQQAVTRSAGAKLGIYTPDWEADYKRSLPGQGNVRRAY